jgi:hypothetical protein
MKNRHYYLSLAAIAVGGAIAKHTLDTWVVQRYLGAEAFDLVDLFHAGASVGIVGGALGLTILGLITRHRLELAIRKDAIALLSAQCGRDDLPEGYRAAIAYVIQDLSSEVQP